MRLPYNQVRKHAANGSRAFRLRMKSQQQREIVTQHVNQSNHSQGSSSSSASEVTTLSTTPYVVQNLVSTRQIVMKPMNNNSTLNAGPGPGRYGNKNKNGSNHHGSKSKKSNKFALTGTAAAMGSSLVLFNQYLFKESDTDPNDSGNVTFLQSLPLLIAKCHYMMHTNYYLNQYIREGLYHGYIRGIGNNINTVTVNNYQYDYEAASRFLTRLVEVAESFDMDSPRLQCYRLRAECMYALSLNSNLNQSLSLSKEKVLTLQAMTNFNVNENDKDEVLLLRLEHIRDKIIQGQIENYESKKKAEKNQSDNKSDGIKLKTSDSDSTPVQALENINTNSLINDPSVLHLNPQELEFLTTAIRACPNCEVQHSILSDITRSFERLLELEEIQTRTIVVSNVSTSNNVSNCNDHLNSGGLDIYGSNQFQRKMTQSQTGNNNNYTSQLNLQILGSGFQSQMNQLSNGIQSVFDDAVSQVTVNINESIGNLQNLSSLVPSARLAGSDEFQDSATKKSDESFTSKDHYKIDLVSESLGTSDTVVSLESELQSELIRKKNSDSVGGAVNQKIKSDVRVDKESDSDAKYIRLVSSAKEKLAQLSLGGSNTNADDSIKSDKKMNSNKSVTFNKISDTDSNTNHTASTISNSQKTNSNSNQIPNIIHHHMTLTPDQKTRIAKSLRLAWRQYPDLELVAAIMQREIDEESSKFHATSMGFGQSHGKNHISMGKSGSEEDLGKLASEINNFNKANFKVGTTSQTKKSQDTNQNSLTVEQIRQSSDNNYLDQEVTVKPSLFNRMSNHSDIKVDKFGDNHSIINPTSTNMDTQTNMLSTINKSNKLNDNVQTSDAKMNPLTQKSIRPYGTLAEPASELYFVLQNSDDSDTQYHDLSCFHKHHDSSTSQTSQNKNMPKFSSILTRRPSIIEKQAINVQGSISDEASTVTPPSSTVSENNSNSSEDNSEDSKFNVKTPNKESNQTQPKVIINNIKNGPRRFIRHISEKFNNTMNINSNLDHIQDASHSSATNRFGSSTVPLNINKSSSLWSRSSQSPQTSPNHQSQQYPSYEQSDRQYHNHNRTSASYPKQTTKATTEFPTDSQGNQLGRTFLHKSMPRASDAMCEVRPKKRNFIKKLSDSLSLRNNRPQERGGRHGKNKSVMNSRKRQIGVLSSDRTVNYSIDTIQEENSYSFNNTQNQNQINFDGQLSMSQSVSHGTGSSDSLSGMTSDGVVTVNSMNKKNYSDYNDSLNTNTMHKNHNNMNINTAFGVTEFSRELSHENLFGVRSADSPTDSHNNTPNSSANDLTTSGGGAVKGFKGQYSKGTVPGSYSTKSNLNKSDDINGNANLSNSTPADSDNIVDPWIASFSENAQSLRYSLTNSLPTVSVPNYVNVNVNFDLMSRSSPASGPGPSNSNSNSSGQYQQVPGPVPPPPQVLRSQNGDVNENNYVAIYLTKSASGKTIIDEVDLRSLDTNKHGYGPGRSISEASLDSGASGSYQLDREGSGDSQSNFGGRSQLFGGPRKGNSKSSNTKQTNQNQKDSPDVNVTQMVYDPYDDCTTFEHDVTGTQSQYNVTGINTITNHHGISEEAQTVLDIIDHLSNKSAQQISSVLLYQANQFAQLPLPLLIGSGIQNLRDLGLTLSENSGLKQAATKVVAEVNRTVSGAGQQNAGQSSFTNLTNVTNFDFDSIVKEMENSYMYYNKGFQNALLGYLLTNKYERGYDNCKTTINKYIAQPVNKVIIQPTNYLIVSPTIYVVKSMNDIVRGIFNMFSSFLEYTFRLDHLRLSPNLNYSYYDVEGNAWRSPTNNLNYDRIGPTALNPSSSLYWLSMHLASIREINHNIHVNQIETQQTRLGRNHTNNISSSLVSLDGMCNGETTNSEEYFGTSSVSSNFDSESGSPRSLSYNRSYGGLGGGLNGFGSNKSLTPQISEDQVYNCSGGSNTNIQDEYINNNERAQSSEGQAADVTGKSRFNRRIDSSDLVNNNNDDNNTSSKLKAKVPKLNKLKLPGHHNSDSDPNMRVLLIKNKLKNPNRSADNLHDLESYDSNSSSVCVSPLSSAPTSAKNSPKIQQNPGPSDMSMSMLDDSSESAAATVTAVQRLSAKSMMSTSIMSVNDNSPGCQSQQQFSLLEKSPGQRLQRYREGRLQHETEASMTRRIKSLRGGPLKMRGRTEDQNNDSTSKMFNDTATATWFKFL